MLLIILIFLYLTFSKKDAMWYFVNCIQRMSNFQHEKISAGSKNACPDFIKLDYFYQHFGTDVEYKT